MKKAPKIEPETIKHGVGNWVLFFVGLEGWKMEAWGVAGGAQEFENRGPADRDVGFWWGEGLWEGES